VCQNRLLKMSQFSTEFMRADLNAESPMVWFIEVGGLVMDSRTLPVEYQIVAFQRGYIPYSPALGPEGTAAATDPDAGTETGAR
jgi:hypothetical protein